jgi:hypothetical protein
MDVPIEGRESLLAVAVDVLGERVAGLLDAGKERAEERAAGGPALQDQRPVVPAPRIVRVRGERGLHLLEVRQAMGVVPGRHALIGRPALEVERVAALEDLAVDAR